MRQKQNEKKRVCLHPTKTRKTKSVPPRSKQLRKTNHNLPQRNRRSVLLRRQMHKPQWTNKTDRTKRKQRPKRSTPTMTCKQCGKVSKAEGNWECTERHWLFSPELAQQQRLCDDKPNYTPEPIGEHTFGPQ
jgi:hypothetical protein